MLQFGLTQFRYPRGISNLLLMPKVGQLHPALLLSVLMWTIPVTWLLTLTILTTLCMSDDTILTADNLCDGI